MLSPPLKGRRLRRVPRWSRQMQRLWHRELLMGCDSGSWSPRRRMVEVVFPERVSFPVRFATAIVLLPVPVLSAYLRF